MSRHVIRKLCCLHHCASARSYSCGAIAAQAAVVVVGESEVVDVVVALDESVAVALSLEQVLLEALAWYL